MHNAERKRSILTQTWWDALFGMYGKCCSHLALTQNHNFHVTLHHDHHHGDKVFFVCGNPHMRNHEDHCWFIYNQEQWLTQCHKLSSLTALWDHLPAHPHWTRSKSQLRVKAAGVSAVCLEFLLLLLLDLQQQVVLADWSAGHGEEEISLSWPHPSFMARVRIAVM